MMPQVMMVLMSCRFRIGHGELLKKHHLYLCHLGGYVPMPCGPMLVPDRKIKEKRPEQQ